MFFFISSNGFFLLLNMSLVGQRSLCSEDQLRRRCRRRTLQSMRNFLLNFLRLKFFLIDDLLVQFDLWRIDVYIHILFKWLGSLFILVLFVDRDDSLLLLNFWLIIRQRSLRPQDNLWCRHRWSALQSMRNLFLNLFRLGRISQVNNIIGRFQRNRCFFQIDDLLFNSNSWVNHHLFMSLKRSSRLIIIEAIISNIMCCLFYFRLFFRQRSIRSQYQWRLLGNYLPTNDCIMWLRSQTDNFIRMGTFQLSWRFLLLLGLEVDWQWLSLLFFKIFRVYFLRDVQILVDIGRSSRDFLLASGSSIVFTGYGLLLETFSIRLTRTKFQFSIGPFFHLFMSMLSKSRRVGTLILRLLQVHTEQFRLIFHKFLLEGLMKVELLSSIDQEDFIGVQSKIFEQFRIDELLDVAAGGHLEMTDQLLPLQTLDVQVDEILVDIIEVDQVDDTLLLEGVFGLLGKLLALEEEDQLLRGHSDLL